MTMILRGLIIALFLSPGLADKESVDLMCPTIGQCSLEQRLQGLEGFFDRSSPKYDGPLYGLKDIARFASGQINKLKEDVRNAINASSKTREPLVEGRQYYTAAADYATGYNTGFAGYGSLLGTGTGSSTTFNGLDAALSALAFLAFIVWLFNLILPQLQAAGLGEPGLGRGIGTQDPFVIGSRINDAPSGNLLTGIFSTGQELINSIFQKDGFPNSKHFVRDLFEGSFAEVKGKNIFYSAVKGWGDLISRSGRAIMERVQDILRFGTKTKTNELKTGQFGTTIYPPQTAYTQQPITATNSYITSSTGQFLQTKEDNRIPKTPISTTPNPWMTHRWKRQTDLRGRGILEDLFGQFWKPLNFLADFISQQRTAHQFPNSRTEGVEETAGLRGEIPQNDVTQSESTVPNDNLNSIDVFGILANSLEEKERHHRLELL